MMPHSVPVVVTYSDRPVVSVRALKLVRVAASKYSFQAKTQVKINVTAKPGRQRGNTISVITFQEEAPSTKAASSNSFGMPSTVGLRVQIAKGRLKVQYTKIIPMRVSNNRHSPTVYTCVINKKSGNKKTAGGAMRLVIVQKKIDSFPLMLKRDNA